MKTARTLGIPALLLLGAAGLVWSQFRGRFADRYSNATGISSGGELGGKEGEFHFIRIEYRDIYYAQRGFGFGSRSGIGRGWWMVDWPEADDHVSSGIKRLTRIDMGEPRHIPLTDDRLFDYPWIYATQTGWWNLSDAEVERLREYLLRGGFLMTDDFWESDQWALFEQTMARVLPGRPIVDVSFDEPIMHVLYDVDISQKTFIPGLRHLWNRGGGQVQIMQPPGTTPTWRAMHDDRDRVIVAVNFNMDVGDAWEHADWPIYPEAMTALAYRFGINYIIYSMTH
jgi:hypothetical protein